MRSRRVRTDTTVVPANVSYPTDSGLLSKGVAKLTKTVGLACRTSFRDRTRSVRRRAHQIVAWLRRRSGDAKDEVLELTGELARIADEVAPPDAASPARCNARRAFVATKWASLTAASRFVTTPITDRADPSTSLGNVTAQRGRYLI